MAKYLRSNVPKKKAIIKGENVEYFVGEQLLLEPQCQPSFFPSHSYENFSTIIPSFLQYSGTSL